MEPSLPSSDDDLDDLLRPSRRSPALQVVLDRVRRTDRRLVVAVAVLAASVVLVLAVMGWRSRPAAVSLPMASATAGSAPAGGVGTVASGPTTSTTVLGPLIVHVAGAVTHPGLVTLPAGARTADAIEQAGGATGPADLERVNLAAPVADGIRVYVPSIGQVDVPAAVGSSPAVPTGGAGDGSEAVPAPVDLNAATSAELETLPGVGPATAAAILAHRDAHGPFASVDALDDVRGIGPAKLEQLRDLVTVG